MKVQEQNVMYIGNKEREILGKFNIPIIFFRAELSKDIGQYLRLKKSLFSIQFFKNIT